MSRYEEFAPSGFVIMFKSAFVKCYGNCFINEQFLYDNKELSCNGEIL
uniref:Uncharacterized protein n=1 Tax=Anguilla anguilla TaxID=7936 RepID=A0A0E9W798_ANGAN